MNIDSSQEYRKRNNINTAPTFLRRVIFAENVMQVVSNDAFRSLKHRVVASEAVERFSFAYFYSPSDDVMIESCTKPSIYRQFSYREYRQQIEKDVEKTGNKVGLPRFFLHNMLPHLGQ